MGSKLFKECPVCGSTEWNHDVVTMSSQVFCGDCYHEVKCAGVSLGLVVIGVGGMVFRDDRSFDRAVQAARGSSKKAESGCGLVGIVW